MKHLLLASTALVAFAGAAAAEVVITGDGRMGVIDDYSNADLAASYATDVANGLPLGTTGVDANLAFTSRVRVAFTLSSTTDSGVSFGGSIRADNADGGAHGTAGNVFMTGAFGKLSMGDVSGAAKAAVGELAYVGLTELRDLNEMFYLQNGSTELTGTGTNDSLSVTPLPVALYEYSTGGFTGYVSLGNPGGQNFLTAYLPGITDVGQTYGVGAKYATDTWWVGAGYENAQLQDNDSSDGVDYSLNINQWIAGGGVTFSGVTLTAIYGEMSTTPLDLTQYGLSASYTFDAWTVNAYWRNVDLNSNTNDSLDFNRSPYGLGVNYDLGGGAQVMAGVVDPDVPGTPVIWDAGVSFKF